jgi:hypothetical protein
MARKLTQADIVERIKEVHGDKYDLSKVNYINRRTKVTLICSIHGEFNTTTEQLFRGQGCYICGKKQSSDNRRTFFDDFVKNAKVIHGEKYKYYPETYIKSSALTKINCNESKGEIKVRQILKDLNIKYTQQKTFDELKDISLLKCDFYLPQYNSIIEFNGRQHYEPVTP